jgi:protocatechuate 3,4-dioxygenase beta subunit
VPVQVSSGVNVSMGRPKTATTDAQGMFEFTGLPAGTYRLIANPNQYSAQYLGISYGAKKANAPGSTDPGQPIQLTDGQSFAAAIALPKGAVIAGHVTDENGDALARVQVYTLFFPQGSTRPQRSGGNASTDDLGQFRLFGLAEGEYIVAAEARNNTFIPPNAPAETEDERIGMMTTFYPGTPDEGAAQRVRTRQGNEASGIEIRMVNGRMLHISGVIVSTNGQKDARFNGQLMARTSTPGMGSSFGFPVDADGKFQMRNIPPGDYRLIVRQNQVRPPTAPNGPPDLGEFAVVPLTLTTDIDNLLVTTSPGITISGQVVYDGTPPASQLGANGQAQSTVRVSAQMGDPQSGGGLPTPPPVTVAQDMTFTMKGLMGEFLIRANGPSQFLKAVQLNGTDITDIPHEFKAGEAVTIVMTTQASMLEGNITDDKGQPVNNASLLLFSDDKTLWRTNSIHTRRGGADVTGHYRMAGVLPGQYLMIALPQERANALNFGSVDPAVFEQFAKEATPVTVGQNEQRQVDLRLAVGSGGG